MGFEFQILDKLQTIHTPLLDRFMVAITKLGDAGIVWIILTVILLLIPKTRKSGVYMAVALIADLIICNVILKPIVLYFAGRKRMAAGALIVSVLIAFSRMYLYVHYPTDVLGGLIIGLLCGWIADMIIQKVMEKRSRKSR